MYKKTEKFTNSAWEPLYLVSKNFFKTSFLLDIESSPLL